MLYAAASTVHNKCTVTSPKNGNRLVDSLRPSLCWALPTSVIGAQHPVLGWVKLYNKESNLFARWVGVPCAMLNA